jgi:hypothetical protein
MTFKDIVIAFAIPVAKIVGGIGLTASMRFLYNNYRESGQSDRRIQAAFGAAEVGGIAIAADGLFSMGGE